MEYTNTEMDAAIADVIHSERDWRLMRRRMIDGIKFEPLAEEFDLSVRHTKTIVESYRQALWKYLARTSHEYSTFTSS